MTDDTAKAREYAKSPLGIRPEIYGAYLDGRLSLRARVQELEEALELFLHEVGGRDELGTVFVRFTQEAVASARNVLHSPADSEEK